MAANGLGEFLRARREAALPVDDRSGSLRRRRTPGLRREEVATRAGISADYYARLEQGRVRHPSVQVLASVSRALELAPEEVAYLHELAIPRGWGATPELPEGPGEYLLMVMNTWTFGPAYIINRRCDVIARNELAWLVFDQFEVTDNILRMVFLDPSAKTTWVDWESFAVAIVGGVRSMLGSDVDQPDTAEFIRDLASRSDDFARLWSIQSVSVPQVKRKSFSHHELGHLEFGFDLLTSMSNPSQLLVIHRSSDSEGEATTPSQ